MEHRDSRLTGTCSVPWKQVECTAGDLVTKSLCLRWTSDFHPRLPVHPVLGSTPGPHTKSTRGLDDDRTPGVTPVTHQVKESTDSQVPCSSGCTGHEMGVPPLSSDPWTVSHSLKKGSPYLSKGQNRNSYAITSWKGSTSSVSRILGNNRDRA